MEKESNGLKNDNDNEYDDNNIIDDIDVQAIKTNLEHSHQNKTNNSNFDNRGNNYNNMNNGGNNYNNMNTINKICNRYRKSKKKNI